MIQQHHIPRILNKLREKAGVSKSDAKKYFEKPAEQKVLDQIARLDSQKDKEEKAKDKYSFNPALNAEECLFDLAFSQKRIKVLKSHYREYDPDQGYWRMISDGAMRKAVADEAQKAHFDYGKGKTKSLCSLKNINATMGLAEVRLFTETSDIDNNHLLAFRNGTVCTKTGTLTEHSPNNLLTHSLPFDYEHGAECPPAMHRFINTSYRGEFDYVRAAFSLVLDMTAPHRFIHCIGPSGSGKGMTVKLFQAMFGRESVGSPNSFTAFKDPDKIRQNISGRRLVTIADTLEFIGSEVATFYEAVECGPLAARSLFASKTDSEVNHTRYVIASVKQLPMSTNSQAGWTRRVLPMVTSIISERDTTLETQLKAELPQIISWALAMPKDYRDKILQDPSRYSESAAEYFIDNAASTSSIWAFVEQCCEPTKPNVGDTLASQEPYAKFTLYNAYKAYCAATGRTPQGMKSFIGDMADLLPTNWVKRRKSGTVPSRLCYVSLRRGLFDIPESSSGFFTCNGDLLGDGGVSAFRDWAKQWGSLYPYERKDLQALNDPLGVSAAEPVQRVPRVPDLKNENQNSQSFSESFENSNAVQNDAVHAVHAAQPPTLSMTEEELIALMESEDGMDSNSDAAYSELDGLEEWPGGAVAELPQNPEGVGTDGARPPG